MMGPRRLSLAALLFAALAAGCAKKQAEPPREVLDPAAMKAFFCRPDDPGGTLPCRLAEELGRASPFSAWPEDGATDVWWGRLYCPEEPREPDWLYTVVVHVRTEPEGAAPHRLALRYWTFTPHLGHGDASELFNALRAGRPLPLESESRRALLGELKTPPATPFEPVQEGADVRVEGAAERYFVRSSDERMLLLGAWARPGSAGARYPYHCIAELWRLRT
jgi:hypothetical protein